MKKEFEILKIQVILSSGSDIVLIYTTSECPFTHEALPSQQPLILRFDCTYNTGKRYCDRNFPSVPVDVINGR